MAMPDGKLAITKTKSKRNELVQGRGAAQMGDTIPALKTQLKKRREKIALRKGAQDDTARMKRSTSQRKRRDVAEQGESAGVTTKFKRKRDDTAELKTKFRRKTKTSSKCRASEVGGVAEQEGTAGVPPKSKRKRDGTGEVKTKLQRKRKTSSKPRASEAVGVAEQDDTAGVPTKSKRKRDGTGEVKTKLQRKRNASVIPRGSEAEAGAEDSAAMICEKGDSVAEKIDTAKPGVPNTVGNKYIPPHLREVEKTSEETIRVQRRIRGLLNRLSEANVESITSELATVYQAHGRLLVTEIVCNEIVGACCEGPRGNDQYAAVFAAFVAGMSAMSGIDFGAKFVASLATSFEDQYGKGDSLAVRNLALLVSHLFSFHLLPSELIYELLAVLCKRFEELDVATILTILQSCGMSLRGDDPSGMKDFVLSIQQRTAEVKAELFRKSDGTSGVLSKRVQFMLDTICDIKNNKKSTKELAPHVHLKKWLQKLPVQDVQLKAVTWKRLLDPVKKGQWWLPSGDSMDHGTDVRGMVAGAMDGGITDADKMLHLAASQRMNTDSRRAVFCMVMSGEDYVDAFEKILRMKLPGTQDREVMRVIVECCLQEKLFNKYYALLAAKLCNHDKNHKFTLQYCLWDQFKQLGTMELRRTANLARLLAHLISSYALSLAVLKTIDFADPQSITSKVVMHFRIFFESLLTENSEDVIWNCFSRVARPPQLAALRDGLSLFLHQHIKPITGHLAKRVRLANKALANVSSTLFN